MDNTHFGDKLDALRQRAEEVLKNRNEESKDPADSDLMMLVRELEMRQIELELQNEELRAARNELQESRNRYAALYQFAPMGYLDLTRDGLIARANIAAREKLGISDQLPTNLAFSALIHTEDRGKFQTCMHHAAKGEKGTCTLRTVGNGETEAFIHLELAPEVDEERKLKGWRLFFVDITDRKSAEKKLVEKEEQLRAELEAMTRLQNIGSIFAKEGALTPVLGAIVEAAVAISGADFGVIQLFDKETSTLQLGAQHGLPQWWSNCWNQACRGQGACSAVLRRRKRTIILDVEESPLLVGTPALEMMRKTGVKTVQCTPLMSRSEQMVGVFSTHYKAKKQLDERALRLLDMLARQTADIIERAQIVEELRRSEERFRALLQASSDAIYQIGPDWKEIRRLFGRDSTQDKRNPGEFWLRSCIYPDDQPALLAKVNESIRNKSVFEHEYRFVRKDGSSGWRFARAIPLMDANQEIVEWFGTASDITQRKEAEEALRESEERFRVAQELSPDGFTILRPVRDDAGSIIDFTWVYENPAVARMSGDDRRDVVGRRLLDVYPEHRSSSFFETSRHVAETGETRVIEDLFSGACLPKPTWFRLAMVRMGGDIAILAQDITERKQMEKQLLKSHEVLETRVRERTASLEAAYEKLRLVPSQLIEVQENESRRLASDLHDTIGQTLAALKFRMEHVLIVVREEKAEKTKKLLEEFIPVMQRSIDETRTMYMGLKPTVLTSRGLLAALEWYRQQLLAVYTKFHIELEGEITEEDIPEGLKTAMFRIAQEALNNSCKHSGGEWIDVRVALKNGYIELEISDDGKGMDLDSVLKSTTAKSLGLIGMRERAEISGGKLFMESALKKGARIRAVWPVGVEKAKDKRAG
ncbi:MAG: PAS domain S-box protein [Syntrophobacteraceae bacterium]|nr:PAS domain S-box protein [Syntrophobacteraceae bacterium]